MELEVKVKGVVVGSRWNNNADYRLDVYVNGEYHPEIYSTDILDNFVYSQEKIHKNKVTIIK